MLNNIHLKEPQRYRAILIDPLTSRDQFLESMLSDRGIVVINRFASLSEASLQTSVPDNDLVILNSAKIDEACLQAIGKFKATVRRPLLLITETDTSHLVWDAVTAGADHVLSIGVSVDRFGAAAQSAMAQFEKTEHFRDEAEKAVRALEDRKLIERAKGIIMEQRGVSEKDAFRDIQDQSMKRNTPMPDMARSIIEAKELLG